MHEKHGHYSECHEKQCHSEKRIELAYQLVHWQKGGGHVIDENHDNPEKPVEALRSQHREKVGGIVDEHRADENHEQQREHTHDVLDLAAQLVSDDFRKRCAVFTQRKHSGKVVVDSTGEYGSEHYPKKRRRAVHHAHYRTEDRAESRYVEELDEKNLPSRQSHIVHAVGHRMHGGGAFRVGTEHIAHELSVSEIADYQYRQSDYGRNHIDSGFLMLVLYCCICIQ